VDKVMFKFCRWATSSFQGCVIFFSLVFAIPEWIYFADDLRSRGLFTINRTFLCVIVATFAQLTCAQVARDTIGEQVSKRVEQMLTKDSKSH